MILLTLNRKVALAKGGKSILRFFSFGGKTKSSAASPRGVSMTSRTALLMAYGEWLLRGGGTAQAQFSVVQSKDGTTGTITH